MPYGDRKAAMGARLQDSSMVRDHWAMRSAVGSLPDLNFRVDSVHLIVPGNE